MKSLLVSGPKGTSKTSKSPTKVRQLDIPTDSNSNQIAIFDAAVRPEEQTHSKQSLESSLEQADVGDYHWCEDDDLSETNRCSSLSEQHSSKEDPHSDESQLRSNSDPSYVALAQKIDSNLAHIDMEDFKSEDIHSLLIDYNTTSKLCCNMQDSLGETPSSQEDYSLTDVSLCKSGPLFSPQRIQTGNRPEFSTDSLNLEKDEWLEEGGGNQLLLAVDCRTNMTNYTLAWSSTSGTDPDVDFNEPGSSSSGSEQSHWSSSGSGGGNRLADRTAPPIPPWPGESRVTCGILPSTELIGENGALPCWASRHLRSFHCTSIKPRPDIPNLRNKTNEPIKTLGNTVAVQKNRKGTFTPNINEGDLCKKLTNEDQSSKSGDNPTLSDMDNGNEKSSRECTNRSKNRPVFTKHGQSNTDHSEALSLLEIYMRQKSSSSMCKETATDCHTSNYTIKKNNQEHEVIASGGGEGWVEDYPSSADEKLGLESVSSSLNDDDDGNDDVKEAGQGSGRSMTLTDVSDIEQASIQIDALPFNNCPQRVIHSSCATSSLDKLIAKIKPFELGLSPASMEEHWNFESRLRRNKTNNEDQLEKCCQTVDSSLGTKEESTLTDPIKPAVYVIFPSYSLPDLSFLKKNDYTWIGDTLLSPQTLSPSCHNYITEDRRSAALDHLKHKDLEQIKDWESLNILLPEDIRALVNQVRQQQTNKVRRTRKPRPKSCDSGVVLREQKFNGSQRSSGYRGSSTITWTESNSTLPPVPQSPPNGVTPNNETPPPLPKRTASLPSGQHSDDTLQHYLVSQDNLTGSSPPRPPLPLGKLYLDKPENDIRTCQPERPKGFSAEGGCNSPNTSYGKNQNIKAKTTYSDSIPSPILRHHSESFDQVTRRNSEAESNVVDLRRNSATNEQNGANKGSITGNLLRKTVSFGEHLSGGFLKMGNSKRRPLSLSHWPGGPLDIDCLETSAPDVNMEQKRELVQAVSVAAAQLCRLMHQSLLNAENEDSLSHTKLISRTINGTLNPALYQLLSDGLLPNISTFFGNVTNSVWRIVEASVKKGPMLPWIEELVFCLNNEENLPEGPVRFGVFVIELVNMGGLDWWLNNLVSKETILRRHYSPNGFLYLCHTTTRHLMEELRASLRPLASLPLDYSVPWKHEIGRDPQTPTRPRSPPILRQHNTPKSQRPLSCVQVTPRTNKAAQYRRTQSHHSGLSPKRNASNEKTDCQTQEFSYLKKKWENLCGQKGNESGSAVSSPKTSCKTDKQQSPLKSRIPRPVNRFLK